MGLDEFLGQGGGKSLAVLLRRHDIVQPVQNEAFSRTPEWLANAELWVAHRKVPWAQVARRDSEGRHLGYVTVHRDFWAIYDQIQVNHDHWLNFIVIDIDGPDAVARALACPAPPSWVVPTPHGAHAGWLIDAVKRDRPKAVRYYHAVRENLRRALNGDPGYTGHGTRNPLYRSHDTRWGDMSLRKLGDLQEALTDTWTTDVAPRTDESPGDGRNTRINRLLWHWARRNPGQLDRLHFQADLLNQMENPPLDPSELTQIVRSVERGLANKRDRPSRWTHEDSVKGGQARAEDLRTHLHQLGNAASVKARKTQAEERMRHVAVLSAKGQSVRQIAEVMKIGKSTVSRYLGQAKEQGLLDQVSSSPSPSPVRPAGPPTSWGLVNGTPPEAPGKGSSEGDDLALLDRRHLTTSQRHALAVELEPLYASAAAGKKVESGKAFGKGHPKVGPNSSPPMKAAVQAGKAVGVGGTGVKDAKKLKAEAPDLFEKVKSGELTTWALALDLVGTCTT